MYTDVSIHQNSDVSKHSCVGMIVLMYLMYQSVIHQHFDVSSDLMYSPALMYHYMNAARNRVISQEP